MGWELIPVDRIRQSCGVGAWDNCSSSVSFQDPDAWILSDLHVMLPVGGREVFFQPLSCILEFSVLCEAADVCALPLSLGSCLVTVPSTSCSASAWCWCSSLCSGCSSAVQVKCPWRRTFIPRFSRRSALLTLLLATPPGVLTSWRSWCPSGSALRSCWSLFPSCTRS